MTDEDADTETVETPVGTLSVETVERLAPTSTNGYYPVAGLAVVIAAVAVAMSVAALAVALRSRRGVRS